MKIMLDKKYKYKSLEFCCPAIGNEIMVGDIKVKHYSDHIPRFKLDRYVLNNCPFCGAKIEVII